MKRFILPLAVAALLAACSKQEPSPPPAKPGRPVAPVAETPAPPKKRTPIPATKPAEPSAAAQRDAKIDDIEPDAVNLDHLSQPLVVKGKKTDATPPPDSSKPE